MVNGGSEANFLSLFALLGAGDRLAFMVPNYMQGSGLGRAFGAGTDRFRLKLHDGRWALDLEELDRAVGKRTKVIMVCNPNNPTGSVLSEDEMDAIVRVAERRGAWIVADEIYRGAELEATPPRSSFWGRSERVVITSGLSKAFAMPGLRVGWAVAPPEVIERIWERHDYTTLTPNIVVGPPGRARDDPRRPRVDPGAHACHHPRQLPAPGAVDAEPRRRASTGHGPPQERSPTPRSDCRARPAAQPNGSARNRACSLVPGEMFGLKKGIRFGFGYDIEHTLKGLARVDEVLAQIAAGA